jgi:hypothetical protein
MPTLVELMLGKGVDHAHGRSLAPFVRGQQCEGRPFVVKSPPVTNPGDPIRVVDDVSATLGNFFRPRSQRPSGR